MKPSAILSCLVALAIPFASANPMHKRHQELAKRARADLEKRSSFTNTRFTFYDVGLGACGIWNVPSDMIVALNVEQFGPGFPGQHCFKTITVTYNGQSVQATITDKCQGCGWGGLDFSRGLFKNFAPEAQGVLLGEWSFN